MGYGGGNIGGYRSDAPQWTLFIGKSIASFDWTQDSITIRFTDGNEITGEAFGDCCSTTWLESIDLPANISGTLVSIEDIGMPDQPYDEKDYECLQFYGVKITTSKGSAVIDYRNESNGYYGGSIDWYWSKQVKGNA
jgi:hypothetical protein